jgi:hypothetical protein
MVPERQVNGLFYFWHRPNLNLTAGGVSVWDASGADLPDCLFHEFDNFQPLPAGADMYDFSLESGLSVECNQPLQSFRLAYKAAGCELELDWNAIMDPLDAQSKAHDEIDATCEGWGSGHYEQGGRVQGTVTVDGRTFDIDCFGARDHTWGPRKMDATMPRQGYEWAVASESSSFLVHSINDVPADQDGLLDTVERHLRGWYIRDGVRSEFGSGEREVTERGPDGRPLRVRVTGEDELGRVLQADGECVNVLRYPCFTFWLDNWCLTRWTFDGQEAWGEEQDFIQLQQHRRFLRAVRAQAGQSR